jgi:VIT1/CCC1 family predicted Fe2+/Mn2+ transporter
MAAARIKIVSGTIFIWVARLNLQGVQKEQCATQTGKGISTEHGREYVSVSSQSDAEHADLARERKELSESPGFELDELAAIYVKRGVDRDLARKVAQQLMAKDALGAHAHDELGISEITTARPVQAALTSAISFSVGAAMPVLMVVVSPASALVPIVSTASLGFLAFLGAIGARAGGANVLRGTARVTFWGALAMALTAAIGKVFGTVV